MGKRPRSFMLYSQLNKTAPVMNSVCVLLSRRFFVLEES